MATHALPAVSRTNGEVRLSTLATEVIATARAFLAHKYLVEFPAEKRADALRMLIGIAIDIEAGEISLGDALSMLHRMNELEVDFP